MNKKILSAFAVVAMAGLILNACKSGGGSGKALVKVGNSSITEGDLETLGRVNPRLKPRLATPAGKQKVLENYVEQEILYQESVNRGLSRSQEVKEKIALYEKILVAQALLDNELDKKVKEFYDGNKDEFERVKVSHILIKAAAPEAPETKPAAKGAKPAAPKGRSEAEALKLAESIRDRIVKGEDFDKLAKELSEDDRTKPASGDLGYVTLKDKRLERWGWLPLSEKAFSMKLNEISEPIKTKDGFHIVKVTEEKKSQSFEEAEAGIKFRLQADLRTQLLDSLKSKYKVQYVEAGAAPAADKAPAAPEAGAAPAVPTEPAAPSAPNP